MVENFPKIAGLILTLKSINPFIKLLTLRSVNIYFSFKIKLRNWTTRTSPNFDHDRQETIWSDYQLSVESKLWSH